MQTCERTQEGNTSEHTHATDSVVRSRTARKVVALCCTASARECSLQAIFRWKQSCSLPSTGHSKSLDIPAQSLRMHFEPLQKHAMIEHLSCSGMVASNQPYFACASRRSPSEYCHSFLWISRTAGIRAGFGTVRKGVMYLVFRVSSCLSDSTLHEPTRCSNRLCTAVYGHMHTFGSAKARSEVARSKCTRRCLVAISPANRLSPSVNSTEVAMRCGHSDITNSSRP